MAEDNNVRQIPEQAGMAEPLIYLPLPIRNIETSQIILNNSETGEPETFVRIIYQDIGGEKALWLPCEIPEDMPVSLAVAFGEEIVRLGKGGQMGGVVPHKPKLWTPS